MTQTHAVASPDSTSPRNATLPSRVTSSARHAKTQTPTAHEVDRYGLQRALVGPGRPVDPGRRAAVERSTGQDLSDVRGTATYGDGDLEVVVVH